MKPQILLLALTAAAFSSCTSAYKTGQTPDDVYFSPAQAADEYVQTKKEDDRSYQGRDEYYDDRYLRMRVSNPRLWSELDDYYYYGNRYDYSYYNNSLYWNNPWTPCSYWNSHYNPYYLSYVIITPSSPVFTHPRITNLNTYNNTLLTNNNYSNPSHPVSGIRPYTNSGSSSYSNNNNSGTRSRNSGNSNAGSFLRNLFNNNSSNNSSSSSSGSRQSNTSSSSSSSSTHSGGSSGGGSAPVRRF
ncbi:MAG: hypothetical protein Q8941_11320 [Bacteroidota bacterium]|nr:hypothetical protein [Bacteroidota bacterium]